MEASALAEMTLPRGLRRTCSHPIEAHFHSLLDGLRLRLETILLRPLDRLGVQITAGNGSSAALIYNDHGLSDFFGLLLIVHRNLNDSRKPDRAAITAEGNKAELCAAVHALPVCFMLVGRSLQALVEVTSLRVSASILDAVEPLPSNPLFRVGGLVLRVELVIERPDSIPLDLGVQEPVDMLQEVLQPVGQRLLPRQPVDVRNPDHASRPTTTRTSCNSQSPAASNPGCTPCP